MALKSIHQETLDVGLQFSILTSIDFFSRKYMLVKPMILCGCGWKLLLKYCTFLFFYSPGSHHPLPIRTKFYNHFFSEFSRFAKLGKVYLMGDTNARLGSLLNDRNLHGHLVSNPNKPLFLEFLEYSGLTILNSVYSTGVPTYEIANQKRSIIDLCLTKLSWFCQKICGRA